MGHERSGTLPHSKRWREIVEAIAPPEGSPGAHVGSLAERTLKNVNSRFLRLHKDPGVQAAFGYLIALASEHLPRERGLASPDTGLNENPSPARLAKHLREWVEENRRSIEYSELASRAGADAIAEWTKSQTEQGVLFGSVSSAESVWANSGNAEGFCQVARSFFANFTERYLRYFLEREASTEFNSLEDRDTFNRRLHDHIADVSRHAFETARITQSFAAGWFNNHARGERPTDRELEGFLAIAFGKLREEIARECTE